MEDSRRASMRLASRKSFVHDIVPLKPPKHYEARVRVNLVAA